jgi:hypothetical protein
MSSLVSVCKRLAALACVGTFPLLAQAQARFDVQGGEYPIIGAVPGDQVFPQIALNASGGYLVWQDNSTDGDGYGISARHINRSLSGSLGIFRVNEAGAGDQTAAQLALLNNGGVVFVWQSAVNASVRVYARFLNPDGTFVTGDIAVSTYTGGDQTAPVVASLNDGTVVVVWSSVGQERTSDGQPVANGMQGVFAQRFSPTGQKLGTEFQVNTTTLLNQRTPAVAALPNGNFVVVWVSEIYRGVSYAVDPSGRSEPGAGGEVYDVILNGQVFDSIGNAVGGELPLSSNALICANPDVASTADGFTVTWSGKPNHQLTDLEYQDGWDIYTRLFNLDGTPKKPEFRVNSYTFGDQFRPRISFQDGIHFLLWTSLMQDGSFEGVVGRLVTSGGDFLSTEFRVNTTTIGRQIYPAVKATGDHTFLTVWSSFVGGLNSFDLFAQRYASSAEQILAAPAAPYVSALSQSRLSVTWPELSGYPGVKYEVYVDQSPTPVVVDNNSALIVSLQPASSHTFTLDYLLADGTRSAMSQPGTGKTWGEDNNYDGLPDDWEARYFGPDPSNWPSASADSDGDGATNLQEFLAGTDPTDPNSVLRVRITPTAQGPRLDWNTEPGIIYQVQSRGADQTWVSIGTPRFAAGKTDSIPLTGDQSVALYRIIRVR